jgi:hypothetical protein
MFSFLLHYMYLSLQAAHNVDTEEEVMDALLQYARQALDRFSSVTDSTSRVSDAAVDNRY